MRRYHLDVQVADKLCLLPPRKFHTVMFPFGKTNKHLNVRAVLLSLAARFAEMCTTLLLVNTLPSQYSLDERNIPCNCVDKRTCSSIPVCRCATSTSFRGCQWHMWARKPLNSNNEVPVQLIMITWRPCHLTCNGVTSAICSTREVKRAFVVWCINFYFILFYF